MNQLHVTCLTMDDLLRDCWIIDQVTKGKLLQEMTESDSCLTASPVAKHQFAPVINTTDRGCLKTKEYLMCTTWFAWFKIIVKEWQFVINMHSLLVG